MSSEVLIDTVSRLYSFAATLKVERHPVPTPVINHLFSTAKRLEKEEAAYQQQAINEIIPVIVLRQFARKLSYTPLPYSHHALLTSVVPDSIRSILDQSVQQFGDNPLLSYLANCDESDWDSSDAIFIPKSLTSELQRCIESSTPVLNKVQLISLSALKQAVNFRRLICFGLPEILAYNYPYIFNSPRAQRILCVYSSYFHSSRPLPTKNRLPSGGVHISLPKVTSSNHVELKKETGPKFSEVSVKPSDGFVQLQGDDDEIEKWVEEIQEQLNYISIIKHNEVQINQDDEVDTGVLIFLENDYATFLNGEPGKSVRCFTSDPVHPMVELPVHELEHGDIVVLRKTGGGDYIAPIADLILGKRAKPCRDAIKMWKTRLCEMIDKSGRRSDRYQMVCILLKAKGAISASPGNLKNWASFEKIKPQNDADFEAVLRLIGYSDQETRQAIESTNEVYIAHKTAGQKISSLLLKVGLKHGYEKISSVGTFELSLSEMLPELQGYFPGISATYTSQDATLGFYSVEYNTKHEIKIPSYQIGRPFLRETLRQQLRGEINEPRS